MSKAKTISCFILWDLSHQIDRLCCVHHYHILRLGPFRSWDNFKTCTATLNLSRPENKCPNQLDQTLNRLYPASSLVQSPCNVRLSPCVHRTDHCPENSQWASGQDDNVSIMWMAQSWENINSWDCRWRVIYTKMAVKISEVTRFGYFYQ